MEEKKSQQGPARTSPRPGRGRVVVVVSLFAVVVAVVSLLPFLAGAADVAYPVGQMDDGKARFYDFRTADGITIRYFVFKAPDGSIRAAFDACHLCWQAGKGYTQKGDFMVCGNCGMRVPLARVGKASGGCNPVPLAGAVSDGRFVIAQTDILQGRKFFDRKGVKP